MSHCPKPSGASNVPSMQSKNTTKGEGMQSVTFMKAFDCEHVWKITNFADEREGIYNTSREILFCHGESMRSTWVITLATASYDSNRYIVTLKIHSKNWTRDKIAKIKMLILKKDGQPSQHMLVRNAVFIAKRDVRRDVVSMSVEKKWLLGRRNGIIHNNCLQICVRICMPTDDPEPIDEAPEQIQAGPLQRDFLALLTDETFSDITLRAGHSEFKAHKAILSARSPVFKAMFSHAMLENLTNVVEITDTTPKVLGQLLQFMYTGYVTNPEETAEELFKVADKYYVFSLKDLCEGILCTTITIENVISLLVLADYYQAEKLKYTTMEYIYHHGREVMMLQEWKDLASTRPRFIVEICQHKLYNH